MTHRAQPAVLSRGSISSLLLVVIVFSFHRLYACLLEVASGSCARARVVNASRPIAWQACLLADEYHPPGTVQFARFSFLRSFVEQVSHTSSLFFCFRDDAFAAMNQPYLLLFTMLRSKQSASTNDDNNHEYTPRHE